MPILQTEFSRLRTSPPRPMTFGQANVARATIDFNVTPAAINDIADAVQLPGGARIIDWYFEADAALTGLTVDVGFMSGEFGSTDGARTCGTELGAAVNVATANTAIVRASKPDGLMSASTVLDRSIGVKFLAAMGAGANRRLHLVILYAAY